MSAKPYPPFRLIKNTDIDAGFCALIVYALNGVRRSLECHQHPVVYFSKQTTAHFYDKTHGENIWEYFFEPVGDFSYLEFSDRLKKGQIATKDVYHPTAHEVAQGHHHEPQRLATFWAWEEPQDKHAWMLEKRQLGRSFVKKYIRVKPHITQLVDAFVAHNFTAKKIIGAHIRGTDFAYAQPTKIETYFEEIDRLVDTLDCPDYQIFLATDQEQFVGQFITRYTGRVVTYNAIRSADETAPFRFKNVSGYKKGEDVLIDLMLLSRTDYLLKGAAAVGEMALWFNESLPCTDFAVESTFDTGSSHLLKSAYLKMNVANKSNSTLAIKRGRQVTRDYFRNMFFLRAMLRAYMRIKNR